MEVTKTTLRVVLNIEEVEALRRFNPAALPALLADQVEPSATITVEPEPTPFQRKLTTKVPYVLCPKCRNRVARHCLKRHLAGQRCKVNRKALEALNGH